MKGQALFYGHSFDSAAADALGSMFRYGDSFFILQQDKAEKNG